MRLNDALININSLNQAEYNELLNIAKKKIISMANKQKWTVYLNDDEITSLVHFGIVKFMRSFNPDKGYQPSTLFFNILYRDMVTGNIKQQKIDENEVILDDVYKGGED